MLFLVFVHKLSLVFALVSVLQTLRPKIRPWRLYARRSRVWNFAGSKRKSDGYGLKRKRNGSQSWQHRRRNDSKPGLRQQRHRPFIVETAEQQVRHEAEEAWTQAIHEVKQLVGQVEGYAERVAVEANMRVRSEAEYEVVATRRQAELAIERERAVMTQLMDKFEALALAAVEEAMAKAERAKRETRTNLDEYGDCANRNAYDRVEGFREFFRQVACTEQERTARKVQKIKDEFVHKDYFANVFKEERDIQEHNLLVIKAQPKRYRVRSEKAEAEKRLEAAQVAAFHDRIQELEAETQVATDGWHEADEAASFTSAQEKRAKLFDEEARKERAALKALEREVSNLKASLHADKAVSEPETCREGDEERFRWQPGEDDGEHVFRGDEDDIEDAFYHPSYTDAKLARLSAETYDQHAEVAREQSVRMVRESETVGAEARAEKEAATAPLTRKPLRRSPRSQSERENTSRCPSWLCGGSRTETVGSDRHEYATKWSREEVFEDR